MKRSAWKKIDPLMLLTFVVFFGVIISTLVAGVN